MLNAMFNAKVGDDVYKQDPTVNELEETLADLFGMEAALFFPSGTMANQTAIIRFDLTLCKWHRNGLRGEYKPLRFERAVELETLWFPSSFSRVSNSLSWSINSLDILSLRML